MIRRRLPMGDSVRRRAYALVMVVGFVAVVSILSMSFVTKTTSSGSLASNLGAEARARSLAASGISIAARFLMYPPSGVSPCSYWTGTGSGGISIDGTADYCTISVSATSIDQRLFKVQSTGYAMDSSGIVRGRRSVAAELLLPPPNQWCVQYVGLVNGSQTFPARLDFLGDLHVNGSINLLSAAKCTGAVTATGSISWPPGSSGGPPTSVQSNQPWRRLPPIATGDWSTYQVNSATYTAATYPVRDLTSSAWPNNGAVVTSGNPAGVLVSTNSIGGGLNMIRLKDNVNFIGMIVVDGDLELDGSNVRVTAVAGYPAIVATRDFVIRSAGRDLTVSGPMLVGGVIRRGNEDAVIQVTGPVITAGSFDTAKSTGMFRASYSASSTTFHNSAGYKDTQPYTILRWTES